MNTQLRASSTGPGATGSPVRATASLSPVSAALFTATSCASTRRQSADTASPASRTTTSPGTSSHVGSSRRSPSRSPRRVCGTIARRDSAVRSAECSWAKPIVAFSTTAKRPVNGAAGCGHTCLGPARGSSFVPNRALAPPPRSTRGRGESCPVRRRRPRPAVSAHRSLPRRPKAARGRRLPAGSELRFRFPSAGTLSVTYPGHQDRPRSLCGPVQVSCEKLSAEGGPGGSSRMLQATGPRRSAMR